MANKKKKTEITPAEMAELFKKHKIRKCQVKVARMSIDCPLYRNALLQKHKIRDCFVRLEYLIAPFTLPSPKKKLLSSNKKLRSEVSWLPTSSSVLMNSLEARSTLAVYQDKNKIVPPVARKGVRRLRSKSMFGNREHLNENVQPNNSNQQYPKDGISELETKFNIPKFGLKPSSDRTLDPKPQQEPSIFQKMFEEFKKRVELKFNKN